MFPILHEVRQNSKKYIVRFGGLNLGEDYQDGNFSDTKNVSSVLYPTITQRFGRVSEGVYENPQAVFSGDGLLVIADCNAIYNGITINQYTDGYSQAFLTEGEKQIAKVGKYIVIFPDKVYFDTEETNLGGTYMLRSMTDKWCGSMCRASSDNEIYGAGLKYSKFEEGDKIRIMRDDWSKYQTATITSISTDRTEFCLDKDIGSDYGDSYETTIEREMPDFEYICESNMRLWGVKDNTIYASKYNDPFSFQKSEGIADDSYYIDVGTEGNFTGCIAYSNYICFFKENLIHKLYGTKPSEFRVITSPVAGVQAGSEKSLKIVDGTLIYKGVNGIYAYGGGNPELISSNFGPRRFEEALAETDGERYYISMRNGDKWGLYVYDITKRMWLKEDDTHAVGMAFSEGNVHILNDSGELLKIDPEAKEHIEWSVTFCPFNETMNERKIYSKFHLRMELGEKSWISVEIKRDNAPKWDTVYTTHNERARTVSIPVIPARCDSVEIRLSGKGKCILKTFIREFQEGSDV